MEKEKIVFKGSHPDSLYRVPADSGAGAGKMARLLRVLRWPLALVLVCVALAVFVYFLMPSNLESDLEIVNSTYWERNSASVGAILHREPDKSVHKPPTTTTDSAGTQKRGPSKTQEIDFYEADSDKKFDLISVIETITENKADRKLPIPPVFPEHIAPEVQYGNEKADTDKLRTPKVLDEENGITSDSTVKPHITQQPEKPLAIYFKDATTESITRAETVNDFNIYDEKVSTKNGGRSNYKTLSSQGTGYTKPQTVETAPDVPPEVQEYYGRRPSNVDVHFTSGHSKFFGIGIEDAEKMQSTTQSSLYNTRVSPTLPTWRDGDDTTTKKYPVVSSDVPQCHSPRLDLCRGVLPYDLAGEAALVGGVDVTTLLPQIDYLVGSNCSDRVRQFVCALLEPECSPAPYPAKLPCYNLCQAIRDSCDGYVPRVLFPAFNCRQYGRENCVGARAPCSERELACGDGTCVLRDWVCDGTQDCPAGEDEKGCSTCDKHEFDCQSGSCIPKQWLCDGYKDCPKGEDEAESSCKDVEATPRDPLHGELGEESAGSAPAPAVRRPNRLPDARIGEHDSSKELLITSDSSNALKRNFTRRPSPSRLTPYRPKLRHPPPSTPHTEEDSSDEKTEKPMPPVRKTLSEVKAAAKQKSKPVVQQQEPENRESDENINVDDLGLFEDFGTERKDNEQPTIKPVLQQRPKSNKEKMERPAIDVDKFPVHVDGLPYPSPVYVPSSGPMRLYTPPAPPTLHPPTRLDKSINQFEKIIDGAALLRKAAAAAAEEARLTANTTEGYEDDYPKSRGRTSHTSPCPSGELRCVDGRCITLAQLCDGTIDCTDHADEDNCFT